MQLTSDRDVIISNRGHNRNIWHSKCCWHTFKQQKTQHSTGKSVLSLSNRKWRSGSFSFFIVWDALCRPWIQMLISKGQCTAGGVDHPRLSMPPSPVTAISQPIKLGDGAEAGWITSTFWDVCACKRRRVRERGPCIMPAPNSCYSRAACDRVKEKPPELTVCQLGYVALWLYAYTQLLTAHCTSI